MELGIAIIEDDVDYREAMCDFLESHADFRLLLQAGSVEDYLWKSRDQTVPDILLMDIHLHGMSGIEGIRHLRENHPDIQVVMLTVMEDWDSIFGALKAGACGYLLKATPPAKLVESLMLTRQGGAPMSPQIAAKIVHYFQPRPTVKKESPLSGRERQVVSAILDGLSYKEVAERLFISIGTVYSHVHKIYRKLHIHSKIELVHKRSRGEI